MADKADNRKLVGALEDTAIEMRVLTTMALAMYGASEAPDTDEDGSEAREALHWCLLEMKARSRNWQWVVTSAALRVDRPAAH